MYGNSNQQTVLLLPRLKAACDVKGDKAGEWNLQGEKAFNDVATSLEYKAPGEVNKISSVPTMWSRPLTLEMVLYDKQHLLRPAMVAQWQGMLAALALAELRSFPLRAQLIELKKKNKSFAQALVDLLPNYEGRNLYKLEDKHPWEDVYVFLWKNKPVGLSSPSTLVVPSEAGNWEGLPWWNQETKQLEAPQSKINIAEKALLWGWLKNLSDGLNDHNGDPAAINIILGLIAEFQDTLTEDPSQKEILSDSFDFFGVQINRGVLTGLNRPVKAPEQPSSVKLMASSRKEGEKRRLLLYDPEMPGQWGVKPQNIWIHEGKTLASLKPEELGNYQVKWEKEVIVLEKDELFLEELYFINLDEALPGALLPPVRNNEAILFNQKRVTLLTPLNPILLDYLTSEDLRSRIQFQVLKEQGNKIRVTLTLPLSGVQQEPGNGKKKNTPSQSYVLYKDYEIKEENLLSDQLPVLEIWPNFQAEGWKEYYGFYYDGELGNSTFQVTFPNAKNTNAFKQGRGNYQIVHLESFPESIHCLDQDKQVIGLILLKSPEAVSLSKTWTVGVDFGTSFTNIYVNKKDDAETLKLENLLYRVTQSNPETRLPVLFEYFIPEDFIPQERPLPLSSVLTSKGKNDKNEKMLPILDGRIYVPDNLRFEPKEDWIKTDLKWSTENLPFNDIFIQNLVLYITALAAKAEVKEIEWRVSYPSAFSDSDKNLYAGTWQELTTALEKTTGITQNHPSLDSNSFRTESLAVAQYFADFEEHNLVYSTCIDLGGGTSDISIWEENVLVHQCSVQLAGRDIFSQFLEMNPKFFEEKLKFEPKKWSGLKGGAFNAKLDVWLRLESETWLKNQKKSLQNDPSLQGLVQLTAIGIAGLYYYVGILLKVLHREEKYKMGKITPVYIGGNGSRFLNWLDSRGVFDNKSQTNQLLSQMLSVGSGFGDTQEITRLSKNQKHEVACGLVLKETRLKGIDTKGEDPLITGEEVRIRTYNQEDDFQNTQTLSSEARLSIDKNLDVLDFEVSQLVVLPQFLFEFHRSLRDLQITEITPLNNYTRSLDREKNKKLWDETERELKDMLSKLKENTPKSGGQKGYQNIRWEPPFILGLKALLRVLGKEWAGK